MIRKASAIMAGDVSAWLPRWTAARPGAWQLAWHFFRTSRPYSYVCNIARAVLVCGLLAPQDGGAIAVSGLVSLLMWLSFNWYSDTSQGDTGRMPVPWWLIAAPLALTVVLTAFYQVDALPWLGLFVVAQAVYPLKALCPWVGLLGPVLRGLVVIGHFAYLSVLLGADRLNEQAWLTFAVFSVLIMARNLVGDLRDIRQDRYEFPARFGAAATFAVLRLMFVVVLAIGLGDPRGLAPVMAFVGILWAVMELLGRRLGTLGSHLAGYVLHRLFVILFTLAELVVAMAHGVDGTLCLALAAATLLLSPFYGVTPGKSYPHWPELRRALAARRFPNT